MNKENSTKIIIGGSLLVGLGLWVKNLLSKKKKIYNMPINKKHKNVFYEIGEWVQNTKDYNPQEKVFIADKEQLVKKLMRLRQDGLHNIQVASDYDQTITSFFDKENSQECPPTFGCFRLSGIMSQEMMDTLQKNYDYYHPIEIDNTLEYQEKKQKMLEWYEETELTLMKEGPTKQKCIEVLNKTKLTLRYGFDRFFKNCKQMSIPFYLVSGGIDLFIASSLHTITDINYYRNFFLFSNRLIFNRKGKLIEVQMTIDETKKNKILNKDNFQFYKNTLIFGDANHDIEMGRDMGNKCSLGIAFLKEEQRDQMPFYIEKGWDIIIVGEGNFLIHQQLLQFISGNDDIINVSQEDKSRFTRNPNYYEIRGLFNEAISRLR